MLLVVITTALPVAQEVQNVVANPTVPVPKPLSIADGNVPNLVPLVVDPNPPTTTVAPVVVTTVPTTLKPNATQVEGGDDDDSSEEEDEETNDVNDDDDEDGDDDEPGPGPAVANDEEEEEDNYRKREVYVPGYLSDLGELVVPIEAVMGQGATYEIVDNVDEVLKEEQAADDAVTALGDNLAVENGEGVIGVVPPASNVVEPADSAAVPASGEVPDASPAIVNEVEAKDNAGVVEQGLYEVPVSSSQSVENVKEE